MTALQPDAGHLRDRRSHEGIELPVRTRRLQVRRTNGDPFGVLLNARREHFG
jgi:hypothetical protein